MHRYYVFLVPILAVMAACARDPSTAEQPVTGFVGDQAGLHFSVPTATASPAEADPSCDVALPHNGRTDGSSAGEAGAAAAGTTHSVPALERLGWHYIELARSTYDPGYYVRAEQVAECLASRQDAHAGALLLRGHALHNLHRFAEAESAARELVALRGRWFDYGLLGDTLIEQGKVDAAVDAYQAMADRRPGAEAYIRAAQVRWITGDLNGAVDAMERALRASALRNPSVAAWQLTRLGQLEFEAGRPDAANHHAARALERVAHYPPALVLTARGMVAAGRPAQAVPLLRRALEQEPLPDTRWLLIEALEQAARPGDAQALAAEQVRRGADEDPRTLALYLATRGIDAQTAVELAQEEMSARGDVFTLDALAWALHAAGRADEAWRYAQRVLSVGTQSARLYLHAGVIARSCGEPLQARSLLAQADALAHTLLPSEQRLLEKEIATVASQAMILAAGTTGCQELHTI